MNFMSFGWFIGSTKVTLANLNLLLNLKSMFFHFGYNCICVYLFHNFLDLLFSNIYLSFSMGTKGHKEKELWKLPLYFSASEQVASSSNVLLEAEY